MTDLIKFDPELMKQQREKQSEALTDFYRSWWERKDMENAIDHRYGLCKLLASYAQYWNHAGLGLELSLQFRNAGLCQTFPFGGTNFHVHRYAHTQNKDPNRIEWVRLHIPELNK